MDRPTLEELYHAALDEVVDAILVQLDEGRVPVLERAPRVSLQGNGLPDISEPFFERVGPTEFSSVLEPPFGDGSARSEGRFPRRTFPVLASLTEAVLSNPDHCLAFGGPLPAELLRVAIPLGIEGAANNHLQRFGRERTTRTSRRAVLLPLFRGLFDRDLPVAYVVPIAMVRFDFTRLRLGPNTLLLKMSDALQQARWTGRARGAAGHDSVLAAATHALFVTGKSLSNGPHLDFFRGIQFDPSVESELDSFFAALCLVTGVNSGYAQTFCLPRGWHPAFSARSQAVFSQPAKKYPEEFDDYGWTSKHIPLIGSGAAKQVGSLWIEFRNHGTRMQLAARRYTMAMRRGNAGDALLDATIALEVLLSNDKESISWKLRMRAAALAGLLGDRAQMLRMRDDVRHIYDIRSKVVHGSNALETDVREGKDKALAVLGNIIKVLIANPRYLDIALLDEELLLGRLPAADAWEGDSDRS